MDEWLIIIDAPLDMTLQCWVQGEEPHRVFLVKISRAKNVAQLKVAIKAKRPVFFSDVDANNLWLYKVSIDRNGTYQDALKNWSSYQQESLAPLEPLREVFSDLPPSKQIHIIVQEGSASRRAWLRGYTSFCMSSGFVIESFMSQQNDPAQTVLCNRPSNAESTIPVTLLHPVFGQFLDDCETLQTASKDNNFALELHLAMSDFHPQERERAVAIRGVFSKWGLVFDYVDSGSPLAMEGHISTDGRCCAIAQFRGEVGATETDPYNLAAWYYPKATSSYAATMMKSCLPCMIILVFGPYIAFAGAAWNLRPQMQMLSLVLPMHFHHTDTNTWAKVARHLGAFRKAVCTLQDYYQGLAETSTDQPQVFPYHTKFTSLRGGREQSFEYVSQPFDDKLVFYGELPDKWRVCIKFVREYTKDVHLFFESLKCAPVLHGFETLPGGWYMIVMDTIGDDYVKLCDAVPTPPVLESVRDCLAQLHAAGYVHDHVRDSSIAVCRSDKSKVMLLDFDWAGTMGKARYPMNVEKVYGVSLLEGMVDGSVITAEHDMGMLDRIRGEGA